MVINQGLLCVHIRGNLAYVAELGSKPPSTAIPLAAYPVCQVT